MLLVVKGCLNYFCPIKHLLVRVFLFVSLGWFGFFLSRYLIFSSLKSSASIFQPSLAVSSNAQAPHSGNSRVPKANTALRVIFSHSQENTGSPPWSAIPLLQNDYSLCLSCCSPSFGGYLRPAQASSRLAELGATAELPSPTGSVSKELCLTLTPAL